MERWILAIEYDIEKFETAQREWLKHQVFIRMVSSMREAVEELSKNSKYVLIAIFSEGSDYLSWMKALRDITVSPILVMKSEYDAMEKIEAINLGADEYMARPATVEESVASTYALIRRFTEYCGKSQWCATVHCSRDVFMCIETRKVFVRGKEIDLTKTEFDLFHIFMTNRKRVFTFDLLFQMVWGYDHIESSSSNLWNHIKNLRQKLKTEPDMPDYIKSVRDVGYKFDPD